MKVAVISVSGNVGKTTIARHLLAPRIAGAEIISVESINADEHQGDAVRGRQFGELQEYLLTAGSVVIDVGASNIEDFLRLMGKFRGSHEDFDYFVVPTVPALKQQQDTIATLAELERLGVPREKLRVVFNMAEDEERLGDEFHLVNAYCVAHGLAAASNGRVIWQNELYGRIKTLGQEDGCAVSISELASDEADYKALLAKADSPEVKARLAHKLATRRLAQGVLPELDSCFKALELV